MTEMVIHDDRDTIIAGLREQLRQTREELAKERSKGGVVDVGVVNLRRVLSPLYGALQQVFGEIDTLTEAGVGAEVREVGKSLKSAAWDSWKQKLSGSAAKAIDTLMIHGELTADQLRIHLGCATRTCYNIIGELNHAKLINKNGGKVSLREL